MIDTNNPTALTGALEDYLETIYELTRTRAKVARVRDIASARNVKAASVTLALRRLSEMKLVNYVQREHVDLTAEGEQQARRVLARHRLLTQFFRDVLQMPEDAAQEQACVLEHGLGNEAMDRLTRFFEFLEVCTQARTGLLSRFHGCTLLHPGGPPSDPACEVCRASDPDGAPRSPEAMSVSDLAPGQQGVVTRVSALGTVRQRLLDMGILPNATVEVERLAPTGDPVWIKLEGAHLALRKKEADAVQVVVR